MPKGTTTKKTVKKEAKPRVRKSTGSLSLPLLGLNGKEIGTAELPKEIFGSKANPRLLAQYVRVYLTNQRQGNASTKTRGEVTGSTRKIYRQKGTGKARHGDIKAPIFVGGGVVGGPLPKNISLSLNKKQKTKALAGAFTLRFSQGDIVGLSDNFLKMTPKTKEFAGFLKVSGLVNTSIMIILPKMEKNNLVLASRNIPYLTLSEAQSINAYEVLKNKKILMVEGSILALKDHFIPKKHEN